MLSLIALLKVAKTFGLDREKIKETAEKHGLQTAENKAVDFLRARIEAKRPQILATLAKDAPLDGKSRKDKDGDMFTDREYFVHEALYQVVKAVLGKGGPLIDFQRDKHFPKVSARVLALYPPHSPATPEEMLGAVINEELAETF